MNFKNKKVAILGWGINGVDAAKFLSKEEAVITIMDKNNNLDLTGFENNNFKFRLGKDYLKQGLTEFDIVFRTPAVYRYLPEIVDAEKKGVLVTSAIKIFFDLCPSKIIGVTGTKGKGTTSTLINEILKMDGKDTYLAGNIGYPVLELLPKLNKDSWIVLELSSFQLIDLTKSPHISVVLNITSDHMDWHKDRKEYLEAKTNIVCHQSDNDFAVINFDYGDSKKFEKLTNAKKFFFSIKEKVPGSYVHDGMIFLNLDKEIEIGNTKSLLLRGQHNWENITAALCTSALTGVKHQSIKDAIFSFKGLEHRLELVRNFKGIKFYNDSFSTNPQTTVAAINSFKEPVTIILGGSDKGLDYDDMGKHISEQGNVENIFLIGDIGHLIKKSIEKYKFKGNIKYLGKPEMSLLVKECFLSSRKGGVVILSPGTASFDMFKDYKERGTKFKEAVKLL